MASAAADPTPLDNEVLLETVRSRLVAGVAPQRIVVFGSRARGDHRADSDLDLMVVAEISGSLAARSLAVRRHLLDVPAAMDVVVYTPEEYERLRRWQTSVAGIAEREGRVLHG